MTIYPAIDLRGGRVVRLEQGDYARETAYDADPARLAGSYARAGAAWLHVVDLDAARVGIGRHRALIGRMVDAARIPVQAGGGVRDEAGIDALLVAGVARIVLGSVAVREPVRVQGWLERYGAERLCLALDARADAAGDYRLPVAGWTEDSGERLYALLDRYAAHGVLKHVLCTDVARDGTYAGPNLALYRTLAARYPALEFQASGGVRDLGDVRDARDAGAAGVVVGKALLDGRIAIEALLDRDSPAWRTGRPSC